MRKTENNFITLLMGISALSILISGVIFYLYEDYLDTKKHVKYYQINFTPYKNDLYESAKVSFYNCGSYSNDSNAVQSVRKKAIAERKVFINKMNRLIAEEYKATTKQLKKPSNKDKFFREVEEEVYKEISEEFYNKQDSATTTECYVFRVTYTRDFKIDDFETVIKGSTSTIDGLINALKTYTDIHPKGTFVYYRVL